MANRPSIVFGVIWPTPPSRVDHPREEDHHQIGRVALHPRVAQRQDLVGGGGPAHGALAVQRAVGIDVAERQGEVDFGLEHSSYGR